MFGFQIARCDLTLPTCEKNDVLFRNFLKTFFVMPFTEQTFFDSEIYDTNPIKSYIL